MSFGVGFRLADTSCSPPPRRDWKMREEESSCRGGGTRNAAVCEVSDGKTNSLYYFTEAERDSSSPSLRYCRLGKKRTRQYLAMSPHGGRSRLSVCCPLHISNAVQVKHWTKVKANTEIWRDDDDDHHRQHHPRTARHRCHDAWELQAV